MQFKTILSVLTRPDHIAADLTPAQSAAQEQDAHLDLLCLGIDQVQTGYYFAGASAALYQEGRAQADEDARRIAATDRNIREFLVREKMDEAGDGIDDAWITSKVKTQLLADDQVKGTQINVDTKGNVVTLTGTAPSAVSKATLAPMRHSFQRGRPRLRASHTA